MRIGGTENQYDRLYGGKAGYISKTGEFVIPPKYDDASDFIDGYAMVRIGSKWGLIDRSGNYVVSPKFTFIGGYVDGLAPASKSRDIFGSGFDWLFYLESFISKVLGSN